MAFATKNKQFCFTKRHQTDFHWKVTMPHFFICKYDYDDPAYVDEWTTLCALLGSTGTNDPWEEYLQLEEAFLDVVV